MKKLLPFALMLALLGIGGQFAGCFGVQDAKGLGIENYFFNTKNIGEESGGGFWAKRLGRQSPQRQAQPDTALSLLLARRGLRNARLWLRINKTRLHLQVMAADSCLKTYPVVLGGNPTDDKRYEGDRCTPEGRFKVQAKYPHRSWQRFIWIDYPTADSWRKFRTDEAAGKLPPKATIGGDIGIHGVPADADYLIDDTQHWTLGCIALKNSHIREIYEVVRPGTVVQIVR